VLALPAELEAFRAALRQRCEARIAPLIPEIDRTGKFSDILWGELRDAEIFSLPFPALYGGLDGSFLAFVVAVEELSRVGAIAGLYPGTTVQVATALIRYGSDDLRAKWLSPLIRGEGPAAWAFTEPETGSDPKQIQTRADRLSDGSWELNGEKTFISYARQALVALVFARLAEGGLGAFLVETDRPGYSVGEPFEVLAFGGGEAAPVTLDHIRLPPESVVGDPGAGFDVMLAGEAEGKIRASAINVGIAQRALDEAAVFATRRLHRGVPIAEQFPTIQAMLGEMEAQIQGARTYVRAVAQHIDMGATGLAKEAASARLLSGRCAQEVTSNALQVCGAYGWTKELPVERLYREAKFFQVTQGVAEIQRVIVARQLLAEVAT
jgi:alkylation response protein AidB-like acyl-CoA dehydrogenase